MPEYPFVEVAVTVGLQTLIGDALPDTGFDGALIVPVAARQEIEVPPVRRILRMADNHAVSVLSWRGAVQIRERAFPVRVHAFGDHFIIGREILDRMEICFCSRAGSSDSVLGVTGE